MSIDGKYTIEQLAQRLDILESEAAIRKVQSRYMLLCDTPCPVYPPVTDAERIEMILDLYTEDAVWEGVGDYYTGQFGRAEGKDAVRAHFNRFWPADQNPRRILNAHYLTSENITVEGDRAEGTWIHMQPWLYDDGTALLRSSRLNNAFRRVDGEWKVSRTRTENVFIADLPDNFAESYPEQSVLFR
ncbi:nuclear transport factor 2 family protein [Corynebacterium nuruki]|jgi:ketosteroid isomerase-like protein|uniref:nuclear transport factor 2 family protein n=1 Tax=Corynebacterium nuruki TaxID=1032851 RepID=UPI0002487217|nr:nuclear transport factor 2 family protein [Corynebacterium nuruki]